MVLLETHELVVAGVRLTYLERAASEGAGVEPPLLLLHGLLATAGTFVGLIEQLPVDRRIVALDLLSAQGMGPAGRVEVSLAPLASLVSKFLRATVMEGAILVGHSHGGLLGLQIAATERNALRGLVLLSPAHPFGGYRSHVVAFYLKPHGRALALSIPLAPRWAILRAFNEAAGPGSRITHTQLQPYMRVLRHRDSLRRVLEMLRTWEADMGDLRDRLRQEPLSLPVLLVWGDSDEIVPLGSATGLKQHLLASELQVLPGVGHLLSEEAPRGCGGLLRDWLTRFATRTTGVR